MTFHCYPCKFHTEHAGAYKRHISSKKHTKVMETEAKTKAEAIEAAKIASEAVLDEEDEEDEDVFDDDMSTELIIKYYKETIRYLKKQIKMKDVRIDMLENTTVTNITNNIKVVINDPNLDDRAIGPVYMCVQQAMQKKCLERFSPNMDPDSIPDYSMDDEGNINIQSNNNS
jgi:hypothetical protein